MWLQKSSRVFPQRSSDALRNSSTTKVEQAGGDLEVKAPHLSLDDPVHDGLHGFHLVTLHDSFEVLRAVLEGLRDGDVQVVVGLLSSQVLQRR